ncbi:MAG: glycosyltransferase family 4 protein, partial [Elusimicrobiota bacterium]
APKVRNSVDFDRQQNYKIYRYSFFYSLIEKYPKLYKLFIFPILFLFVIHGLKIIKKENIAFIQCGSADLGLAGWCLSKLTGKPYLIYTHGNDIIVKRHSLSSQLWKNRVIAIALRKANAVIANSNFTKTKIVEYSVSSDKVTIVNPCIKAGIFYPKQEEAITIRKKYNLENKKVLLSVGRLVTRKGHDFVIKALPNILKSFPDTIYLIVGKGNEKNRLRELVKGLTLEKNVVFVGYVPDSELNGYYNACDIFIMPSRELSGDVEGFGIVYLEANACRKPVIGGKTGGIQDAIVDGETGLLVKPTDIKEISDAVIKILSDEKLATTLGNKGYTRIVNEFSSKRITEKINNTLFSIF